MNFSNRTELARAVLKNLLIRGIKFPDSWEAPEEFFSIDGHCGLLAAWAVLIISESNPAQNRPLMGKLRSRF